MPVPEKPGRKGMSCNSSHEKLNTGEDKQAGKALNVFPATPHARREMHFNAGGLIN
jgi:hypothetical protein